MARSRLGLKLLGVGLVLGLGAYGGWYLYAKHVADSEEARARNAGIWTSPQELANQQVIPDAQNAAVLYQPLCASFSEQADSLGHLDFNNDREVDVAFRTAGPFIKQFIEAAKLPACQFRRDWTNYAGVTFPEYSSLKTIVKLCASEAISMSRKGKPEDALRLLSDVAPIALHVGMEPAFISPLVQFSLDSIILSAIQDVVGAHGLKPNIPELAETVLQRLGPPLTLDRALCGECAIMSEVFKSGSDMKDLFGNDQGLQAIKAQLAPIRLGWKVEMLRRVEDLHQVFSQTHLTPKELLARTREVDQKHQDDVTAVLGWSGDSIVEALISDISSRTALRTLLAGLESWQKTGHAPTTLPLTVPPAVDPFTSEPMKFATIPGGFKVWGRGWDGKDYGGVSRHPGTKASDGDTLFEYPYIAPIQTAKTSKPARTPSAPKPGPSF